MYPPNHPNSPNPEQDFPSIEQLQLTPDVLLEGVPVELPSQQRRRQRHFLPALPAALFVRLAVLPGKALAVYLVALQRSRIKRTNPVALTSAYLSQFGLMRWDKTRALAVLEKAGLVRVERQKRKNPLVHLVEENARHERKRI
jgi:hypothetical protein